MGRTAKLRKKKKLWYTAAGGGKSFGNWKVVTRAEATAQFKEYMAQLARAPRHKSHGKTVNDLAELFLAWMENERAQSNLDERRRHIGRFMSLPVGKGTMGDLSAVRVHSQHMEDFKAALQKTFPKMSAFTVDKHLTSIKHLFNWATTHPSPVSYLPSGHSPFRCVSKYKRPPSIVRQYDLITPIEHQALLDWADADIEPVRKGGKTRVRRRHEWRPPEQNPYYGFRDMVMMYYYTGARTSELPRCDVKDYIAATGNLVLTWEKRSAKMKVPMTRVISLPTEAQAIVTKHCNGKQPTDPIFTDPKGRRWTKDTLDNHFAHIRGRAGVRGGITIYSYRHLWISEALMSGSIEPMTVAQMAGTSFNVMETTYMHFRAGHLEHAHKVLAEVRASAAWTNSQSGSPIDTSASTSAADQVGSGAAAAP